MGLLTAFMVLNATAEGARCQRLGVPLLLFLNVSRTSAMVVLLALWQRQARAKRRHPTPWLAAAPQKPNLSLSRSTEMTRPALVWIGDRLFGSESGKREGLRAQIQEACTMKALVAVSRCGASHACQISAPKRKPRGALKGSPCRELQ